MSNKTVELKIKVDDDGTFKKVSVDAGDLNEAIKGISESALTLDQKMININQMSQAFDSVQQSISQLQGVMQGFVQAYADSEAASTRLSVAMKNTMSATQSEIDSVLELTAAQQKLGVIDDDIQTAGAQELATYLSKSDSLKALIPVMNDMVAQQYSYNATEEAAVTIASMMGKVLDGQTGALSRYGYSFTEAQENVLKFGTEQERVAMLSEVVEQYVGGQNAALRDTPVGEIQSLSMRMGDLKENIGGMLAPTMNVVTKIASLTIAFAGISRGVVAIQAAIVALKGFGTSAALASAKTVLLGIHSKVTAAAQTILSAATKGAAVSTTALSLAVTGLYAAMTMGIALVIEGLVMLFQKLRAKQDAAAEGFESLKRASDEMSSTYGSARSEIDTNIASLKKLIDAGSDTTKMINHLNESYGEAFGYYNTAAEWYNVLMTKSEAYCRRLGYEAKAKTLSAEIGAKIVALDQKKEDLSKLPPTVTSSMPMGFSGSVDIEITNPKIDKIKEEIKNAENEIKAMQDELLKSTSEASKAADEMSGGSNAAATSVNWQKQSYTDLGKTIQEHRTKLESLIGVDAVAAAAERKLLDLMIERQKLLANQYGLNSGSGSNNHTPTPKHGKAKLLTELNVIPAPAQVTDDYENLEISDTFAAHNKALLDNMTQSMLNYYHSIDQPTFAGAYAGMKALGNSIRDISSAIQDSDNAWDMLTNTIDGFLNLISSIEAIVKMIEAVTAASQTFAAVKTAESAKVTAANAVESTSNTAVAATGAAASMASIPWVGPALAIAAVAAVIASLASLPKFANGGLVYGPTVGLMGEYGGASSNPEVIAPLSKLQGMLGNAGNGEVRFRIEGRELVGILNKQSNINSRTK